MKKSRDLSLSNHTGRKILDIFTNHISIIPLVKSQERDMAKAPAGVAELDWDNLSDDQLKEVMRQAKKRSSARFSKKLEEFREDAREEGFEVTLTPVSR